jgi:hypothetical protein
VKASIFTDEEQLITKAVEVLMKALGPIEASRFLTLPKKKRLESVKRHRQWQAQLQKEEFFGRVFGAGSSSAARK